MRKVERYYSNMGSHKIKSLNILGHTGNGQTGSEYKCSQWAWGYFSRGGNFSHATFFYLSIYLYDFPTILINNHHTNYVFLLF